MEQVKVLKTQGTKLVDSNGAVLTLRGVGLGGWMNMENFITGYPANETAQRQIIHELLGKERAGLFFERFLECFFTEDDAKFIHSLGLNLLRIPVNYRHFEDDMEPFAIKESGFKHLDRVIELCAKHEIYTIIDLHALPGSQNQAWHSDNTTHKAFFWEHKHFQDRAVNLWEAFARHYKHNPWVAGYNPINEPADPSEQQIMPVYHRIVEAIRAIDAEHIIFLEGNCYSRDFHMFGDPLPNIVYTNHDYALPGFVDGGPYPGYSRGVYVDRDVLESTFLKRSEYMLEHEVPIWVGEFGPVYTGNPDADAMRYQVLRDQLEIYAKYEVSWALWTYKDIGLQGVTYAAPESPWLTRIGPFLKKKARLGADAWGGLDKDIRHIMAPLERFFAEEFPDYDPFPFGVQRHINRLVRHILFSEPLLKDFGECFKDTNAADIHTMMESFLLKNCITRQTLADILRSFA